MNRSLALWAAALLALWAGCTSGPALTSQKIDGGQLVLAFDNKITVKLWATTDGSLRVRAEHAGKTFVPTPTTVEKPATAQNPAAQKDGFALAGLLVKPAPGGFAVFSGEKELYRSSFAWDELTGQLTESRNVLDKERFFGLGGVSNSLSLAGQSFAIRQRAEYGNQTFLYIPWVFTSGGDGFYNNAWTGDTYQFAPDLTDGTPAAQAVVGSKAEALDYYYWHQPDLKKNVARFYDFSGSKALLPRWAYGYIQSKYGYRNQAEVETLVNTFKEKDLPLSAVVLDLYWFKRMGDLDWDRTAWPNPEGLDKKLEQAGIKLITITEPYFTEDSKTYVDFKAKNLFVKDADGKTLTWSSWWAFDQGGGSMFDLWAPGAAEALSAAYAKQLQTGIDGFWTDLGEPEEIPAGGLFGGQEPDKIHNAYNREWSRILYETALKTKPDQRPFILSRSGFTGSTGYNVSVWSGDVSSNFASLAVQPALGLGAGLAGLPYWGSDVGGFVSKGLPERETWLRWQQFGVFSPVYRAHGSQSPREPWSLAGEPERIVSNQIRLRHQLLPYIYSSAWQSYTQGLPLMRPLFLEFPDEPALQTENSTYLFGDSILVAPVSVSIRNQPKKEILLPGRDPWLDFYTLDKVPAGKFEAKLTLEHLPVYLRSGTILPQTVAGKDNLLLLPGAAPSSFVWYLDDGVSLAYKNGQGEPRTVDLTAEKISISGVKTAQTVTLQIPAAWLMPKNPAWKLKDKVYELEVALKPGTNEAVF